MLSPDEVDSRIADEIGRLPHDTFPICIRASYAVAAAMIVVPHFQQANEPFPSGSPSDPASLGLCIGWWHVLPVLLDLSLQERQLEIVVDGWDYLSIE